MARGKKKPPTAPEPTGTVEWLLGTCSVHVQHLMDKGGKKGYRSLFTSDESRKAFKEEIYAISKLGVTLRPWKARVFQLFEFEWTLREPKVMKRFSQEYLHGRADNWTTADQEPGLPDQNNADERGNRTYKDEATDWNRLSLRAWYREHMEWMRKHPFTNQLFLTKAEHIKEDQWRSVQQLLRDTFMFEVTATRELEITYSPFHPPKKATCVFLLSKESYKTIASKHGGERSTIEEHAKPILQNKELLYTGDMDRITSLEDFHKSSKGACMLYSIVRPGAATSCACTCIDYQMKETCDCSLAWDVKHGRIQIPEEKDIKVIGEETKRGGRRKARKGGALTFDQPRYSIPPKAPAATAPPPHPFG